MPLVFVALVDAVGQRIAVQAHQKAQDDLRVAVAALLREPGFADLVLVVGLEVKRNTTPILPPKISIVWRTLMS